MRSPLPITYLGWSGFQIKANADTTVFIDPPPGTTISAFPNVIVLITHGHPDHVGGVSAWLQKNELPAALTIVGSPPLISYLRNKHSETAAQFHAISPGEDLMFAHGISVCAIEWTHMGHIPAELGNALSHLGGFLRHPFKTLGIAADALRGPPSAPMLGFCIRTGSENQLLYYGEGIHRNADRSEVHANIEALAPLVTMFAVEPEDIQQLPQILNDAGIRNAIIYEAHAGWRRHFDIGNVDLDQVCAMLAAAGISARTP